MTYKFESRYHDCRLYLAAWADYGATDYLMNHIEQCVSCRGLVDGDPSDLPIPLSANAQMVLNARKARNQRQVKLNSMGILASAFFVVLVCFTFAPTTKPPQSTKEPKGLTRDIRNSESFLNSQKVRARIFIKHNKLERMHAEIGTSAFKVHLENVDDPNELLRIVDWIAMRKVTELYAQLIRFCAHPAGKVSRRAAMRLHNLNPTELRPHIGIVKETRDLIPTKSMRMVVDKIIAKASR